jgi:glutathione S-transferase
MSEQGLVLHAHPLSSYCWKVLIALYENDTPFTLKELNLGDPEEATAFARLWPIAKMPVLVDRGRTIAESSIIVEYLDHHHRGRVRFIPGHADPDHALRVRMMDRMFDAYVMTPMQQIISNRLRPAEAKDPFGVAQAEALLDKAYGWLDSELEGRTWAAGEDFSLADCAAAPALHYAAKVRRFGEHRGALIAYLARLEARTSVARVLTEAVPYAHMFPQG